MNDRELLDDDGENRAVRSFLACYTSKAMTIGEMKNNMELFGWKDHPAFVNKMSDWTMTKGTAQMWIRHLFSLEAKEQP